MLTSSPSPTIYPSTASTGAFRTHAAPHALQRASPRNSRYSPHAVTTASAGNSTSSSGNTPSSAFQSLTVAGSAATLTGRTVDASTQYSPRLDSSSQMHLSRKRQSPQEGSSEESRTVSGESSTQPPPLSTPGNPPDEPEIGPQGASKRAVSVEKSDKSSSNTSSPPKRVRSARPGVKLMPVQYETCDVSDLVVLISNMLMELVRLNDVIPLRDGGLTRFHSRAPPGISIPDYLQRLTTHATLSPPILLSMVYYIDRLCALYPAFNISSLTVHRFLITAATVASKGLSDSFWTNATYARVGGVTVRELALLELEFLWRLEWRIVPQPEVLEDYYKSLTERTDGYEIEPAEEGNRAGPSSASPSNVEPASNDTQVEMDTSENRQEG